MRIGAAIGAAAIWLVAGLAAAQTPDVIKSGVNAKGELMIAAGDRMIVRLGPGWRPTLDRIEPASAPAARVPDGEVSLTLTVDPQAGSLLQVQSGAAKPLRYQLRIAIVRGGEVLEAPVTTCAVRPRVVSTQNWPRPIQGVHIVSFSKAGRDASCR
jgi:hypothetical protein